MSHTRRVGSLPRPSRRAQFRLLRGLLQTPESVLDEIVATVGPVCRLGGGPFRLVVLGDPATVRALLLESADRFRWDHPLSPFPFAVGATTMLASDGEDHRRRRGAVHDHRDPAVEQTDVAIDRLLAGHSAGEPVDLAPWGQRLVIGNVVRVLFGERLVDRTAEIEQRFDRIQRHLGAPLWRQAPHPFPFGSRGAVRRDRRALDDLIDGEIAAVRSSVEHDPFDILAALVQRGDLTDEEIRDQVKTLIGAGYDTTASSLAWLVWEASLADGVWGRLREEAAGAFRDDRDVSLASLELAGRVVRETLRLHPGSGIAPSNTIVAWSPYLTGRDPGAWIDPRRFDPERFVGLDDASRATADLAWMPFGRGPRSCIGFGLALMQLTLVLARLAQRVDLAPTTRVLPPAEGLVVSRPRGGAPMHVAAA
jgi:enediyne biosynthesis protein E7